LTKSGCSSAYRIAYFRSGLEQRRVKWQASCSLRFFFVGLFLEFAGGLLILFANLVEFLHVLEELGASLKSDEELCLLAVSTVVGGLHSNRLGFDL
jgi:hypothetical protein